MLGIWSKAAWACQHGRQLLLSSCGRFKVADERQSGCSMHASWEYLQHVQRSRQGGEHWRHAALLHTWQATLVGLDSCVAQQLQLASQRAQAAAAGTSRHCLVVPQEHCRGDGAAPQQDRRCMLTLRRCLSAVRSVSTSSTTGCLASKLRGSSRQLPYTLHQHRRSHADNQMLDWHRQLRARASLQIHAAMRRACSTQSNPSNCGQHCLACHTGIAARLHGRSSAALGSSRCQSNTQTLHTVSQTGCQAAWQGLCCSRELSGRAWLPLQPDNTRSCAYLRCKASAAAGSCGRLPPPPAGEQCCFWGQPGPGGCAQPGCGPECCSHAAAGETRRACRWAGGPSL